MVSKKVRSNDSFTMGILGTGGAFILFAELFRLANGTFLFLSGDLFKLDGGSLLCEPMTILLLEGGLFI